MCRHDSLSLCQTALKRMPSCADADNKSTLAAAAAEEAAEEAATGEAAAMLASMASEEHGDETGLQCEEALPAEEHAGKSVAGSPSVPSSQARGAEQHLGWKVSSATRLCEALLLCTTLAMLQMPLMPTQAAMALSVLLHKC